ncbi:MAG: DUF5043 domain-containing protein, partial [Candidatus Azobacteroides sp.]|nr:DUF5043 domain-containing protein [Candidatus Azobacteroides sp.]
LSGQTEFYAETKVITDEGYQYKCDVDNYTGLVTLYNITNKFTYTNWLNKDGSEIKEDVYFGRIPTLEQDDWTRQKCFSIVNNTFSEQQKKQMNNQSVGIRMIIDSTTGKVSEVDFTFSDNSPYQQIPLSVFREIEEELKKNIWFTLTEDGKKLNYCMVVWMHDFE